MSVFEVAAAVYIASAVMGLALLVLVATTAAYLHFSGR